MVKKSTPLEKAARMLDLVPFISAHQGISTSDLALQFGISEDELLSDLNALWMCGDSRFDLIDLDFDSGFVTIRNAETLNLARSLSQQEIIAIVIGLDLIEKSLAPERSDIAIEISSLKAKLGEGISRILDANPAYDTEKISHIQSALGNNRKIHIQYFSPSSDEVTDRNITPLDLSIIDGNLFVTAYCDSAQAERTFRMDRIQKVEILDSIGTQQSASLLQQDKTISTVKVHRNARRSREILGEILSDDGSTLSISSFSEEWLSRTVISAAGAIEVTGPSNTRSHIAKGAAQALHQYR